MDPGGYMFLASFVGGDEEARNRASHHAIGAGPGCDGHFGCALCKLLLPSAVQGTARAEPKEQGLACVLSGSPVVGIG